MNAWIRTSLRLCLGGLATASFLFFCQNASGRESKPAVADLTGLSLEELYNMDIVQLNVLGAHTHPKNEIMFGYDFMYMDMAGYKAGTRSLTPEEVIKQYGYPVVHEEMEMQMHMFDVMYALTDDLTVMGMLPYKNMSMRHLMADGERFTQHGDGIGDFEAMALYTFYRKRVGAANHRLVLNAGMSFPTGSIDVQDHRSGDKNLPYGQLEYPMQLGSGTFDALPGITYLGNSKHWEWGAQAMGTLRLAENDAGYRLGNVFNGTAWLAYGVTDWLAPYIRTEGRVWGNIAGRDSRLNPAGNPESDPSKQGGERIDLLGGVNLYAPRGWLKGARFLLEGGAPVYEDLDGPQIGTQFMITAGVSYSF